MIEIEISEIYIAVTVDISVHFFVGQRVTESRSRLAKLMQFIDEFTRIILSQTKPENLDKTIHD